MMQRLLRGSAASRVLASSGQLVKVPKRPSLTEHVKLASAGATSTSGSAQQTANGGSQPSWTIKMLFDGACPLCMREVNSLRKAKGASNINFVDVAADDYDPYQHANIGFEEAMGKIHAIRRDGQVVTNVEAFKQLYEAAGRGWVYSFAKIGPLRWLADTIYDFWARYRLQITGRPDLATVMKNKTCR